MWKYPYKTKPYEHQKNALNESAEKVQWAYFMEMGTGKTKVTIDNLTGEVLLSTENTQEQKLTLNFVNSAIAEKDFSLVMTHIAENQYRGQLKKTLQGIWNLYLESDSGWQVSTRLDLAKFQSATFSL